MPLEEELERTQKGYRLAGLELRKLGEKLASLEKRLFSLENAQKREE